MVNGSIHELARLESPFRLQGWKEFVEYKWRLSARELVWKPEASALPELRVLVYVDRAGHIRSVPHQTYHPVVFAHTDTSIPHRLEHQWIASTEGLATLMGDTGLGGAISLNLPYADIRSWQWKGFRTDTKYTHILPLPFDASTVSSAVRRAVRKSHELGYVSEITEDADAVMSCVLATEARKGFAHHLTSGDLRLLVRLMGVENCRMYLCRTRSGEIASGGVVLTTSGGLAIDWINGTRPNHYLGRAHQNLREFILNDLSATDVRGVDLDGSNIKGVASSKAEWGGYLHQYFVVESRGLKTLAKDMRWLERSLQTRLVAKVAAVSQLVQAEWFEHFIK